MPSPIALIVSLVPALVLAAERDGASISEVVMVYRSHGLGGERACRKLIHRLERMDFLAVVAGSREDRREKAIQLTGRGRAQLRVMANHLATLGLTVELGRESDNDPDSVVLTGGLSTATG
jgi:hypothetical protein